MTHQDFIDSTSYAHRLAEANEAEARRMEPWAWAIAVPILVCIFAGAWHLVAWVVS
jgi:hypothetical protein